MPMDPITRPFDDIAGAVQPAASPGDPAVADPPADPSPTNSPSETDVLAPPSIGEASPLVDPSSPAPSAINQGSPLVPDDMAALHPEGGYVAMRLLSRMQTDLDVLTGGKRAATYPEVEEYLGHALVAEGIAPRGYSAEQAAIWWSMGGSAVLRASADGAGDEPVPNGMVPGDGANTIGLGGPAQSDAFPGQQRDEYIRDDPAAGSDQDSTIEITAGDGPVAGNAESMPAASPEMPGDTDPAAGEQPADPTASASPGGTKAQTPIDAKTALAEAKKQAVAAVEAAKTIAKTSKVAPFGSDLSTVDKGFGDAAHGFHGDYRTRPEKRAWLPEIEPLAKSKTPYPDGLPGDIGLSIDGGRKIRDEVAYLYTLPEVKAFLDLIAHTEGADKLGYYLSHSGRPKLADLDSFHGGTSASGRYQILPGAWKTIGGALWSRPDFSEITQDLIAITLLRNRGAIGELLKGNLSAALTLASPEFASIPVSLAVDHSYYSGTNDKRDDKGKVERDAKGRVLTEKRLQSRPIRFRDLPAEFARHLQFREAEFRRAEQEWKIHKILPKAFIPPTRWQSFGLPGFDRPARKVN